MDRITSNLRTILTGRTIMQKDLRNSKADIFKVTEVLNSERGYLIIKGESQFDVIYLPYKAGEALVDKKYCIYRETYDTTVVEYEIEICGK